MLWQEQKHLPTACLTSSYQWQNYTGTARQELEGHEEKLLEKRQENEPVRERDRIAEGEVDTHRQ